MKRRIGIVAVLVFLVVLVVVRIGSQFSLADLASHESELRGLVETKPWLVYPIAFVLYVVASWIPVTKGKALLCGWLFGFWGGLVVVDLAALTAIVSAFLASRYWFRDAAESRLAKYRDVFNRHLDRHAGLYLFELRLLPVLPALVVSMGMGLTNMRAASHCAYSQLGMLPVIVISVYAGAHVPELHEVMQRGWRGLLSPQLVVGFCLLAMLPVVSPCILSRAKAFIAREQ